MTKEFIVSLNVSFCTPLGVKATSEKEAEKKAIIKFNRLFKEFNDKKLDDIADLVVDIDYVEEDN